MLITPVNFNPIKKRSISFRANREIYSVGNQETKKTLVMPKLVQDIFAAILTANISIDDVKKDNKKETLPTIDTDKQIDPVNNKETKATEEEFAPINTKDQTQAINEEDLIDPYASINEADLDTEDENAVKLRELIPTIKKALTKKTKVVRESEEIFALAETVRKDVAELLEDKRLTKKKPNKKTNMFEVDGKKYKKEYQESGAIVLSLLNDNNEEVQKITYYSSPLDIKEVVIKKDETIYKYNYLYTAPTVCRILKNNVEKTYFTKGGGISLRSYEERLSSDNKDLKEISNKKYTIDFGETCYDFTVKESSNLSEYDADLILKFEGNRLKEYLSQVKLGIMSSVISAGKHYQFN